MAGHVKWDVRTGGDGLFHVTRTEVSRTTKANGNQVTRVRTDHTKTGVTTERK